MASKINYNKGDFIMESIYKNCPQYKSKSFMLRLVNIDDAEALLKCYSDKTAVEKINDDNCLSSFYFTELTQMQDCINFWLDEYSQEFYVRFSIILKQLNTPIGTVEISGGEFGILRIDIATEYETEEYLEGILKIAIFDFVPDFGIENIEIKASNTPERIDLLKKYGFTASKTFRPGLGYYERKIHNYFNKSKGLAYCGLACCVCSENINCAGCRNDGCNGKEWCKPFMCCKEKGIEGCWKCSDFPCDNPMLNKLRIRTFNNFIKEYGEEALINCLQKNEEKGIIYHYDSQLIGDYDLFSTEEEIKELILCGLELLI